MIAAGARWPSSCRGHAVSPRCRPAFSARAVVDRQAARPRRALVVVDVLGPDGVAPFIYFQF